MKLEDVSDMGAFHLVKISGISGLAVNGTRFVSSSHWKIPRKSGKSKKVGPFSRLEFPNGMSCPIYVSRSLYQFQARLGTATYRGLRPNGTTFYQSEIPLLLPPKFPGFFPKWKAPIPTTDTMMYCLNTQSQLCFVEVAWHPWVHGDPNTRPNFWL